MGAGQYEGAALPIAASLGRQRLAFAVGRGSAGRYECQSIFIRLVKVPAVEEEGKYEWSSFEEGDMPVGVGMERRDKRVYMCAFNASFSFLRSSFP